ncbi:MAG: flavin reductase family protein [Thermodesulfobacteriota bacterium]
MSKQNIGPQAFVLPMAVSLLGTVVNGKPNFMALGWLTRVNFKPPLIGIGVGQSHRTHRAIEETGEFSLSFPRRSQLVETDYAGLVSGAHTDKSALFEVFHGELKNAPMIKDAPYAMECRLTQAVPLPTNTFFIAEIVNAYCDEDCIKDGAVDPERAEPFMLTMPDNRYWSLGPSIGRAWHDGKTLKKS